MMDRGVAVQPGLRTLFELQYSEVVSKREFLSQLKLLNEKSLQCLHNEKVYNDLQRVCWESLGLHVLQRVRIARSEDRCNSYGLSVCLSVCLSLPHVPVYCPDK